VIRTFCDHCNVEVPPQEPVYRFQTMARGTAMMTAHLHWACIVAYLLALGAPTSPNPTANEEP